MLDKLESVINRYDEVSRMLYEPDVINDTKRFASLMKEQSTLAPVAEKYREYKNALSDMKEAEIMMTSIYVLKYSKNIQLSFQYF